MVAGRRINRNDLVNGDKAPLCDVEIANEFKPGFKALLPSVEFGISTACIVAGILGNAAHIAQRTSYLDGKDLCIWRENELWSARTLKSTCIDERKCRYNHHDHTHQEWT